MKKVLYPVVLVSICTLIGCSNSCSDANESSKQQLTIAAEDFTLKSELLGRIPDDSLGFIVWQGSHPAYQRVLNSPWAESASLTSLLPDSNPQLTQVFDVLAAADLDPRDLNVMAQIFAEAVLFSYRAGDAQVQHGLLFKPETQTASKVIGSLTEAVEKSSYASSKVEVAGKQGVKILLPQQAKNPPIGNVATVERELFAVAHDDIAILALSEAAIQRVVEKTTPSAPKVIESADFKQVMQPLPSSADRFVTGYFDVAGLVTPKAENAADVQQSFPLRAVGLSNSMSELPQMDLIALPSDASKAAAFFTASSATLESAKFRGLLPGKPLLFLGVDGAMLQQLKLSLAARFGGAGSDLDQRLAFLSSLSRFAIAAKVAPVGQSILPIPELLFLLETSEPSKTKDAIKRLVSMGLKNSPMTASLQWTEKTLVDGSTIESMMSPLGIGLSLAEKDNLVFVTSSEPLAQAILAGGGEANFQSSLPPRISELYSEENNLSEFYLDFVEVGTLLQNMGGVLALYAPQDKNAQQLLEAEKIAKLKKMGLLSARVRYRDGLVSLRTLNSLPTEKGST